MSTLLRQLEALPVSERLQLVEDLWDSIANNADELPVPDWQKDELARRKQAYRENPESARPWSEIKRAILGSGD